MSNPANSRQQPAPAPLWKSFLVLTLTPVAAGLLFLALFAALPALCSLLGTPRVVTAWGVEVTPWLANLPGVVLWTAATAWMVPRRSLPSRGRGS